MQRVRLSSFEHRLFNQLLILGVKRSQQTVIDNRINETGVRIRQAYGLTDDFLDPSESTGSDLIYTVGQIHADSSNSKLNDTSLLLQTSRLVGAGARVPLRFSKDCVVRGGPSGVSGVGFFVGGVWGFKGRNGSGEWFEVTEILVVRFPPLCLPFASEELTIAPLHLLSPNLH